MAHMTRMRQTLPAAIARVSSTLTARVHVCVGAGMEMSSFAGESWPLPARHGGCRKYLWVYSPDAAL